MTSQENLEKFNKIYDETYSDILKFIVIKCHNINDANDILQETYLEFWKKLTELKIEDDKVKNYLIGISSNKIKKHYTLISRLKEISIFNKTTDDLEIIDNIKDEIDIEKYVIKEEYFSKLWGYIKEEKNQKIPKIFYLYYELNISIKDIAKILGVSESYVKNSIYRTLKKLNLKLKEEDGFDVKQKIIEKNY